MLFNSFQYIAGFLPVVVIVYYLLVRDGRVRASILWLAAVSYLFYLSGEHVYPWLLGLSVLVNYTLGRAISQRVHRAVPVGVSAAANAGVGAAESRPARGIAPDPPAGNGTAAGHDSPASQPTSVAARRLLVLAVALNLGLLAVAKYAGFLSSVVTGHQVWDIALPIGISFFTFTQIAYLADVYQGQRAERSLVSYLLFVAYFPHLIAGPILHHREMLPQFRNPVRRPFSPWVLSGIVMFTIGLAKKVLLADPCGAVASSIFAQAAGPEPPSLFLAWIGALAYGMQIYFDFSGYSDMAIGASQIIGIKLPINFNSPYKSISIIDFWRRWHISLSRFLRDYLYIPLGGNRKGPERRYVNLVTTMVLGGIWHGAGWTFLVWGVLHGTAQAINHAWRDLGRRRRLPVIPTWAAWTMTFVFVIVAWVPFRAPAMSDAVVMWRSMLGLNGWALPAIGPLVRVGDVLGLGSAHVQFTTMQLAVLLVAMGIAVMAPNSQQLLRPYDVGLDSKGYDAFGPPSRFQLAGGWGTVAFTAVLLGLSLRLLGGPSEFLYFQF